MTAILALGLLLLTSTAGGAGGDHTVWEDEEEAREAALHDEGLDEDPEESGDDSSDG